MIRWSKFPLIDQNARRPNILIGLFQHFWRYAFIEHPGLNKIDKILFHDLHKLLSKIGKQNRSPSSLLFIVENILQKFMRFQRFFREISRITNIHHGASLEIIINLIQTYSQWKMKFLDKSHAKTLKVVYKFERFFMSLLDFYRINRVFRRKKMV